jgi:HTH-type transcriptional regulator / antitoxin HipB
VRIDSPRDLGSYVRERRRELGKTQSALATDAGVSRRWLSDLEGGKPTAEIGLVLRAMHALRLDLLAEPVEPLPGAFDLEEIIADLRKPRD